MNNEKAIKLVEEIKEAMYQDSEGHCSHCGAKDYPVRDDKKGYEEVEPEDAEEWNIDHSDTCPVVKLDQLEALLTEKPNKTCICVADFDCISLREYLLSEKNRITRCLKREEKTHKEFLKRYNKDDYSGWIKRISIPEFEKELYWVNENIKALDIIESLNRSKEDVSEYREKLAELAHKQWSGWIKYMFGKCPGKADGTILIPEWAVTRWQRQACTPYSKLSEKEQESDRTEADKFIAIIESLEAE